MANYPTRVPLIVRNSGYEEVAGYEGDPAVSISHRVSRTHHIADNAEHPHLYTAYFRVVNKLPVPMRNVVVHLGLEEDPGSRVCNVDFSNHDGTEIFGDSHPPIEVGTIPQGGTSLSKQYTYTITRARPFGELENFGVKVYFWPVFEIDYTNTSEFNSPTQVVAE